MSSVLQEPETPQQPLLVCILLLECKLLVLEKMEDGASAEFKRGPRHFNRLCAEMGSHWPHVFHTIVSCMRRVCVRNLLSEKQENWVWEAPPL